MEPKRRFLAGASCLSLALLLAGGSGFLAFWERAANGEHDIVARGGILLYMFLPYLVLVVLIVVVALTSPAMRRAGLRWRATLGVPLLTVLAAALLLFAPPFLIWHALRILPDSTRPAADFIAAAALAAGGIRLIWHRAPTRPSDVS